MIFFSLIQLIAIEKQYSTYDLFYVWQGLTSLSMNYPDAFPLCPFHAKQGTHVKIHLCWIGDSNSETSWNIHTKTNNILSFTPGPPWLINGNVEWWLNLIYWSIIQEKYRYNVAIKHILRDWNHKNINQFFNTIVNGICHPKSKWLFGWLIDWPNKNIRPVEACEIQRRITYVLFKTWTRLFHDGLIDWLIDWYIVWFIY